MIGKTILNYQIESLIGEGGMGTVYLARHKNLSEQMAAIKVIKAEKVNAYTQTSIKAEAENLAHLKHQNIVAFHDYHIDEEGNIYLIMEYVDGMNLSEYIATVSGLIVQERILGFFNPILDGMGYAHKHGVIHRDIKPSNISIASDGTPKILDFGIATLLKKEENESERMIVGTPQYMSPEQVKGEKLDQRSDIYSLGVVLHQMLTGKAPYDPTTMTGHKLDKAIVEEPLPRLKTFYKYTTDKVQKVVDKATAKRPEDRYQSCEEFKRAINNAINPPKISRATWVAIVVAALLVLGGGIFSWLYFRTSVEYYKDYTLNRGVPEGIGEISSFDAKHVHRMYQFSYSKFKLREVKHVNCLGIVIPDTESERADRPLWSSYYYDADGNISKVKVRNTCGTVLYVQSFNENQSTVIFQYDDEHGTEKTLNSITSGYTNKFDAFENHGKITRYLIQYDDKGYVSKIEYAGFLNVKVCNSDGIYAIAYERDAKGRKTKESYLGKDGKPTSTRWGLSFKTFEYDDEDNWISSKYFSMDGKGSFDVEDGISVYEMEYDKYGNMVESHFKNPEGEPVITKRYGFAGERFEYDDNGYIVKFEALGLDGNLMFTPEHYAYYTTTVNEYGFFNSMKYYDIDGVPCSSSNGCFEIKDSVDSHGLLLERWFFDVNGDLTLNEEGIAGFRCTYDKKGNLLSYMGYGIDYKPTLMAGNDIAGYSREYNELNQIIKETNLGVDSLPTKNNDGVVTFVLDYDARGNVIKTGYFEADGMTRAMNNSGYSSYARDYDDHGNITALIFYDTDDHETNCNAGYSKEVKTFDENSNVITIRYFDHEGNPVSGDNNSSVGTDFKYDSFGNQIENKPVDAKGNLAKGLLIAKRKYDDYHNEIEFAVFDEKGPALNSNSYHRYTAKYDSRNNVTEIRYYDTKGNLTKFSGEKICIKRMEYDNIGQLVKTSYFNENEQPELCHQGYAIQETQYDKYGNISLEVYKGKDGGAPDTTKIVPQVACKYDIYQNRISMECRNASGKPIVFKPYGFCKMESTYDKHRNVTSEAYFDTKGTPVKHTNLGYFKVVRTYDSRDNKLSESYFNVDSQPMKVNGYATEKSKYDGKGRLIESSYYDEKGNLTNVGAAGFARMVFEYEGNNTTPQKCTCYSSSGKRLFVMKYVNGEWVPVSGINNNSPVAATVQRENTNSQDWQSPLIEMKANCPYTLNEFLVLSNISINNDNVTLTLKFTNASKYNMTNDELKQLDEECMSVKSTLRESLNIPKSVSLTIKCVDKADRIIKSI